MLAVPLAVSCANDPATESTDSAAEPTAESQQPLVNGTPSNAGYAGFLRTPKGSCTATLIGKQTALTAAHCAETGDRVNFCIFPDGNTRDSSGRPNPNGICSSGNAIGNPNYDGSYDWDDDVEVIHLDRDMVMATVSARWPKGVMPLLIGGPVQDGERITLTGYGCDNDGAKTGGGLQRTGENSISSVHGLTFESNDRSRAHSCEGDSGGPAALPSGCVVGAMLGTEWYFGTTYRFNRTDAKVPWIQSVANDPTVRACGQSVCGDGLCQGLESCSSCPQDCNVGCPPPPRCGDGVCNGTETTRSCPGDCPVGTCSGGKMDCCDTGVCLTGAACKRLGCI